uniref:NAC domain-containing protein n=1 Tax=Lactuca sativa TaxID=4236 RepID=A0A9R1WB92_LACSA|nr:hypothetical protein LSAT_V11C200064550 [Lactuca sativa]
MQPRGKVKIVQRRSPRAHFHDEQHRLHGSLHTIMSIWGCSVLDKKYGNRSCTNRPTEKGYWKIIGKDRLFTIGLNWLRERTNWVMHEYRLIDQELEKAGIVQGSSSFGEVGMQQSEQLSSFTF